MIVVWSLLLFDELAVPFQGGVANKCWGCCHTSPCLFILFEVELRRLRFKGRIFDTDFKFSHSCSYV